MMSDTTKKLTFTDGRNPSLIYDTPSLNKINDRFLIVTISLVDNPLVTKNEFRRKFSDFLETNDIRRHLFAKDLSFIIFIEFVTNFIIYSVSLDKFATETLLLVRRNIFHRLSQHI